MIPDKTPARLSLLCGSLFSVAATITCGDVIKCVLLGAVGTVVSYAVSRVLKAIFE